MKIELVSCGYNDCQGKSRNDKIKINGSNVMTCYRGLNMVIVNHQTGEKKTGSYDTWADEAASNRAMIAIMQANVGDYIAIIVWDEGSRKLSDVLRNLLGGLGSTEINNLDKREPWLFCCRVTKRVSRSYSEGEKLIEKRGPTEKTVSGSYTTPELPFERNERLTRLAQINAERRQAEERTRQAEQERLITLSNNHVTQLRNTEQHRKNLLNNTVASIQASLDLLVELRGGSDRELEGMYRILRSYQARI